MCWQIWYIGFRWNQFIGDTVFDFEWSDLAMVRALTLSVPCPFEQFIGAYHNFSSGRGFLGPAPLRIRGLLPEIAPLPVAKEGQDFKRKVRRGRTVKT